MKFFSKNANLRIVLRPGIPREPLAGKPAEPGIYVKFQDGVASVNNEKMIELLKQHPKFGIDFVEDKEKKDPYADNRQDSEPGHDITEMKYGTPEKTYGTKQKVKLSPQMKAALSEYIDEMSNKKAVEILKALKDQGDSNSSVAASDENDEVVVAEKEEIEVPEEISSEEPKEETPSNEIDLSSSLEKSEEPKEEKSKTKDSKPKRRGRKPKTDK